MKLPNGKYTVILADPPWSFSSRGVRSGKYGELDYSSMTTDEICALPVWEITEKNCALFLWTTSAHILTVAPIVMYAWGFKPIRIDSVWKKIKATGKPHSCCGPWGMNDAEFLLMGIKGTMCSQQQGKRNLRTVIPAVYPGQHSQKPDVFRNRIVHRFGDVPRIELFARKQTPGWETWGNEI